LGAADRRNSYHLSRNIYLNSCNAQVKALVVRVKLGLVVVGRSRWGSPLGGGISVNPLEHGKVVVLVTFNYRVLSGMWCW